MKDLKAEKCGTFENGRLTKELVDSPWISLGFEELYKTAFNKNSVMEKLATQARTSV